MFGIGPMELVVIVVVALLIFGPQKLPEFARTIGKGLAEFRRASNDLRQTLALDELQNDLRKTMTDATRASASRPAQAGDTLPAGSGAASGAPPADPASPTPVPPPWKSHPGELPEGIDHEHHEPPAEQDSSSASSPADPELESDPRRTGDPELGNVPVTGVDPAEVRRG
ncbi:twin-arginine translocase TatA/TatE family subunit [Myxococcota bacterium]|nr:twin-arginine translocase TatA/TatE family subunit [Myxococcota bacterium]